MEKAEKDVDTREEVKGESKSIRRPRRERVDNSNDKAESGVMSPIPMSNNAETKGRGRRENAGEIDEVAIKRGAPSEGWMMFTPSEKKTEETEQDRENAANEANKDKHFQENDGDDIILIPDLEEDGDNDQRVAHAPRNITRKIPTLAELESDVKSSIPKEEGGLDLSILLSALVPQSQLLEADQVWSFDELLRDVTDELTGMQKIVIATVTKELTTAKLNQTIQSHLNKSKGHTEKRKN